mgnify:CR=1 FL=1
MRQMLRYAGTQHLNREQIECRMPSFRLFQPILAGATLRERLIGCVGALIGILTTGLLCAHLFGTHSDLPLIVAPIGASAVLLFAVPASPLAQPWPLIGGNTISALVGVLVARAIADPMIATGVAVGLAIAVMSLTRSLHPPGGAAALTAVLGGPAVSSAGLWFPLVPVGINSVILVLLGLVFHRLARRHYPHRSLQTQNPHKTADALPILRIGFNSQDVDAALQSFDETLDISRDDIERLLRSVEQQAIARSHAHLTCADLMSRDVIAVKTEDTPSRARNLLLEHNIRTLPVLDARDRLVGSVSLRDLVEAPGPTLPVAEAASALAETPAASLLAALTDGRRHCVMIVDETHRVVGIVSQTDLLAGLAASLLLHPAAGHAVANGAGI